MTHKGVDDEMPPLTPMQNKPIPEDALAAYRSRVAARQEAADKCCRPPIVWEGKYDDVYHAAMALLDGDGCSAPE